MTPGHVCAIGDQAPLKIEADEVLREWSAVIVNNSHTRVDWQILLLAKLAREECVVRACVRVWVCGCGEVGG